MKIKKTKNILFFTFILLMFSTIFISNLMFGGGVTIANADSYQVVDDGYKIVAYDINIDVNENNVLNITEKIRVNFLEPSHGIERKIPTKYTVKREDGTSTRIRAIVSDVKLQSNWKYKTYNSNSSNNSYKVIYFDSDRYLYGEQDYNFSYTYNLGKDKLKDFDEFYFNLIGTEWDTSISNITFTINMPKEFTYTEDTIGLTFGKYGMSNTLNTYEVDGLTISGHLDGTLDAFTGLTFRLQLEDGYFVGASNNLITPMTYVGIIVPIVCLIVAFILWLFFGKDRKPIPTVEFYPPEGLNSAELAFCYKTNMTDKDLLSLIVYLASKGYIKIQEEGDSDESKSDDDKEYTYIKLKDYDGDNKLEKKFMEILFGKSKEVRSDNISESKVIKLNGLVKLQNSKEKREKLLDKKANRISYLVLLLGIISILIGTYEVFVDSFGSFFCCFILLFPILGVIALKLFNLKGFNIATLFISVWFLFFAGIPTIVLIVNFIKSDYIYFALISILISIVIFVIYIFMQCRTEYGTKILGEIMGFKEFLTKAEKDKLESLVREDPEYFFNILPYTYVLGVSKVWMDKFLDIDLTIPSWYVGSQTRGIYMGYHMHRMLHHTSRHVATTRQKYESRNMSSGGGYSGGGFGGGSGGGFSGGGHGGGGGGRH